MQLQEIIVPSLGSNGPLWSFANEWWYYVLFGLCMIAYCPGRRLTRVVACGAIVAMLMVLPLSISLWFVAWGVGVGVAVLDRYWEGGHSLQAQLSRSFASSRSDGQTPG